MKSSQRSYSGPSFRPTPTVHFDASLNLLLIATSWGQAQSAKVVIDKITEFLNKTEDPDATVIRSRDSVTGTLDQKLKAAVLSANRTIFEIENSQKYESAVELVAIMINKNTLFWVQVGCPHILLKSSPYSLEPISYFPDWSIQLNQKSPLLVSGLGLQSQVNLNSGSYRFVSGQEIFLISRSQLPGVLYSSHDLTVEGLSRILIDDNPDSAFWISQIQLD